MIAEAITKLQEILEVGQKVHLTEIPGDNKQLILQQGAMHQMIPIPARDRKHIADTLDSFKLAGERWGLTSIWICPQQIVGLMDDERREDKLFCPLTMTQQFSFISGLNNRSFDVHGLTRAIRTSLVDTGAHVLLPVLSRVEWASSAKTIAERQHGKESMGRSVENQVNALDEIPEEITLYTPVFDQLPDRSPVRCVIDIDHQNHAFSIEPILDELTVALDHALGLVAENLGTFDNVYFGKPE